MLGVIPSCVQLPIMSGKACIAIFQFMPGIVIITQRFHEIFFAA